MATFLEATKAAEFRAIAVIRTIITIIIHSQQSYRSLLVQQIQAIKPPQKESCNKVKTDVSHREDAVLHIEATIEGLS